MSAKHTPGPWVLAFFGDTPDRPATDGAFEITDPSIELVICARTAYPERKAEQLANARLIAAAPDLLAALKAVVAIADRNTVEFDAARAAIAKAEAQP